MSETSSDDMLQSINAAPRRSEGVRPQGGLPAQTTGLKQCQKTLSRRRQILKSATSSWCSCCQRIHSTERVRSLTHIIYIKKKKEKETDRQKSGHISSKAWRRRVQLCVMWCGVLWTVPQIQIQFLAGWKCVIVPRSTHTVYTVNHNCTQNHDKEAVVHRAVKVINWEEDTTSLRLC